MSSFNWLTWISPTNATLATITGFNYGLGLNPFPTFVSLSLRCAALRQLLRHAL